ncbi:UDP-xylose and UDP-N-acetylglucosamine transporter [Octopus vulgaris]|uniref:UDP-xylose and UDP-N-acetylglucosamine transporter n=1 Tax=Octopus vulgaris TaxID=6645 RepID=A0AA36FE32_OCTVU|nr:UDP-xylose and UDP-N-acetylglucosamine transporter [Octopus vulgaris]
MHPGFPILMVFVGCCSNVVFLELLINEAPSSGNIVTFSQFLFIAVEGFIFTLKMGKVTPVIPLKNYVVMVTMFFAVQVINNLALNFHISMPLHMIFRSGSLMANLILCVILLKKRYKMSKYLAVFMISVGIVLCTIASSKHLKPQEDTEDTDSTYDYFMWLIGIFMLLFALFMSARMGIFQEVIYKKFGKHPSEALFFNHALPLPGFLLLAPDIYKHVILFSQSDQLVSVLNFGIPKMWLFLLGNVLTQYVCIRSVFILTTECTSLTVTLVVTLRKFASLLFSIWYFQNPFTTLHWLGATLVFGGTLVFTEVLQQILSMFRPKKKIQ